MAIHLRRITRWLPPCHREWLEKEKVRIEAASKGTQKCEVVERRGQVALCYTNGCYDYAKFADDYVAWIPGGGKGCGR
jgi:hypothetical protein